MQPVKGALWKDVFVSRRSQPPSERRSASDDETREIPLFPLQVVLFPGMPLPLNIFEPRYHEMIEECLAADRLFGVALITEGAEAGGYAQVCSIGTSAFIERLDRQADGRIAVITRGVQRFRILARLPDDPYPRAVVSMIDEEGGEAVGEDLVEELRGLLGRYLQAVSKKVGQNWGELSMPEDPVVLGYVAGAVLPCSLAEKQELLQTSTVSARLESEVEMLRQELSTASRVRRVQLFSPTLRLSPN
jgi:Lon protease-like protein